MYVNSDGVVQENPKQNYSFASWPQRQGHASMPHRRMSRLSNLSKRANSALGVMLVLAVIATAGMAFSVRSLASAHAPASVNGFGKAVSLGDLRKKKE